jgi:hypothetical protein
VRAFQLSGDPWSEDPGCYLSAAEIGLDPGIARDVVHPLQLATRSITQAERRTDLVARGAIAAEPRHPTQGASGKRRPAS